MCMYRYIWVYVCTYTLSICVFTHTRKLNIHVPWVYLKSLAKSIGMSMCCLTRWPINYLVRAQGIECTFQQVYHGIHRPSIKLYMRVVVAERWESESDVVSLWAWLYLHVLCACMLCMRFKVVTRRHGESSFIDLCLFLCACLMFCMYDARTCVNEMTEWARGHQLMFDFVCMDRKVSMYAHRRWRK